MQKSLEEEKKQQEFAKDSKMQAAKEKVAKATAASGNAAAILQAESELAALEAEKVTGLKPVWINRGGGGRSGRGRGRMGGRGRGARR